jgi:WS/DGAT/MGAT family acyltransferase
MRQLTGLDAAFLYIESQRSFGHVANIVVYERPNDEFRPYEAFFSRIESRLHLVDPFRRKLVQVPLRLDRPYWINDSEFDLEFHVRHIAIPAPGDNEQLAAQVARIISRPLDRSRPLWEVYVLEGLEGGHFAVLTKVHHSTVDGASGVELLTMLLDRTPEGDEIEPDTGEWRAEDPPSDAQLIGRGLVNLVLQPGRLARVTLRTIRQAAERAQDRGLMNTVDTTRRLLPASLGGHSAEGTRAAQQIVAPPTPFNRSISPHRRVALGSARLADIKAIKSELDVTVNDVVMAICAGALRNYLVRHDALPETRLRAMVPVSIRTGEEDDIWTNRVSGMIADLPTDLSDPLERVRAVHESMNAAKAQFDLLPADAIVGFAEFALPAIAAQASRVAAQLRLGDRTRSPINVVISNVPGPRVPLYMAGARMRHFYPVSTLADGGGLNITVQSYLDTLDFGLVSCRELVPDLDDLLALHLDEIDVLLDAAGVGR